VKSVIYSLFTKSIDSISFQLFKLLFSAYSYDKLCILDIDNTIADSWPTLVKRVSYKNEFYRYASINIHPCAQTIFNKYEGFPKLYLSARPLYFYFTTLKWLRKNTDNSFYLLILVPTAHSKLKYLKYLSKKINHLIYIDDLTYNHENGSVKYYQDIIDCLTNFNVTYYGADYINNPNQF